MIVIKLRAARQRMRMQTGKCEGRKRYGDRPGEQEIIERIQELEEQGLNYTAIAAKLNAERVPTQANRQWYPATVSRILAREE